MKTSQTFNQTFTLKNQKVMNNKKYSVSIKTLMAVVFAFVFSAFLNAQFEVPSPSNPGNQTAEDVRVTSSVDYDITVLAGEQVRWAVIGGTITAGGTISSDGDSSLIDWAVASTITVNWDEDLSAAPIGSAVGQIIVQKRSSSAWALNGIARRSNSTSKHSWYTSSRNPQPLSL